MSEVDTVRVVSSLAALIEVNLPFLSRSLTDEEDVSEGLSLLEQTLLSADKAESCDNLANNSLEIDTLVEELYSRVFSKVRVTSKDEQDYKLLIKEAFRKLRNPRVSGRYKLNLEREAVFRDALKNKMLDGFLPIFVRGYSLIDNPRNKKAGIDPYSGLSYFSDILLKELPHQIEESLMEKIALIYVQPNTYVQFIEKNSSSKAEESYKLVDITEKYLPDIFGLKKILALETGEVFSEYNPELLDVSLLDKHFMSSWQDYTTEMTHYGIKNLARLRELLRKRTRLAQRIMAFKLGEIVNLYAKEFRSKMDEYLLETLPLYMEKTSGDAQIFNLVKDYLHSPLPFKSIGGDFGPLEGQYKVLPVKGICEDKALRKLLGFLQSLSPPKENPKMLRLAGSNTNIDYVFNHDWPYLLLESQAFDNHPNLIDHAQRILGDKNNPKRQLVEEYCNNFSLGISRIEPRLVELFNSNRSINKGLQSISKIKIPMQSYLKDKEILFPMDIPGFESLVSNDENEESKEKAFFRGSLFSLPTTEKLRKSLFNFKKAYSNIDGGCALDKWISHTLSDKDLEQIIEGYNPSDAAERGTLIHSLISAPIEGDIKTNPHYNTLKRIGLEPRPSSDYCELEFNTRYKGHSVSFHPDVLLFLKDKSNGNLDIMIIDTKSSRYTPYLEHRYLLQTLFYAKQIGKAMEEKLGIEYNNIVLGLNKMAFFKDAQESYVQFPYKSQKFSPLILIEKDDPLNKVADRIFEESIMGMERASSSSTPEEARAFIFEEYKKSKDKKYCSRCYSEHKKACRVLRKEPSLMSEKNKS